jgi:hypothetical protein
MLRYVVGRVFPGVSKYYNAFSFRDLNCIALIPRRLSLQQRSWENLKPHTVNYHLKCCCVCVLHTEPAVLNTITWRSSIKRSSRFHFFRRPVRLYSQDNLRAFLLASLAWFNCNFSEKILQRNFRNKIKRALFSHKIVITKVLWKQNDKSSESKCDIIVTPWVHFLTC